MEMLRKVYRQGIYRRRVALFYHRQLYYEYDSPELTDFEYDVLEKELKALEERFPKLVLHINEKYRSPFECVGSNLPAEYKVKVGNLIHSYMERKKNPNTPHAQSIRDAHAQYIEKIHNYYNKYLINGVT